MGHVTDRERRRSRAAVAFLGVAVLSTLVYASHSHHDGFDFITSVWAPARALLRGSNPYDPANLVYRRRYGVPQPAALYFPTALLLHAPLVALGRAAAADVMAVLDAALIWGGVLTLVRPRSPRALVATGTLGGLLLLTATTQDAVSVGQVAPWAFLGLGLLSSAPRATRGRAWFVVGLVVISLKPQSALPVLVAAALLGYRRQVLHALAVLVASSVPGLVLLARAAGGMGAAGHAVRANLRFFSHLNQDDLSNPRNNRIDVFAVVSRLHGPTLTSLGWGLLVLAVLAAAAFIGTRRLSSWRMSLPGPLTNPHILALVSLYIAVCLYHQPYDQLMFFCGPLALVGVILSRPGWRPEDAIALIGGSALMIFELAFRASFRARMVSHGFAEATVRSAYFITPTLLALATVALVGVLGLRRIAIAEEASRAVAPTAGQ